MGKAKSLRQRLCSYRVANPDRMGRRTLRLLRSVERIEWQLCRDEASALAREAELLRTLRPKFNRAGVWPGPDRYLLWKAQEDGLAMEVREQPETGWSHIGPTGRQALYLHAALARLLWTKIHPGTLLTQLPAGWFDGTHGGRVFLACEKGLAEEVEAQLALIGNGDIKTLEVLLPPPVCAFDHTARSEDITLILKILAKQSGRLLVAQES